MQGTVAKESDVTSFLFCAWRGIRPSLVGVFAYVFPKSANTANTEYYLHIFNRVFAVFGVFAVGGVSAEQILQILGHGSKYCSVLDANTLQYLRAHANTRAW